MVRIDMTQEPEFRTDTAEGWHLIQVAEAKETTSAAGNDMFSCQLGIVGDDSVTVYANIMLTGRGWGMGRATLTALGVAADYSGELYADQIENARAWAFLKREGYTNREGRDAQRWTVDISQGTHSGYQPESNPPAGAEVPAVVEDDDAPF